MTTQAIARRRRPRGLHPKRTDGEPQPRRLPEYLEADEVDAIIRAAEDPRAKLLMLTQWRAGLRVSEALALDVSDLSLDSDLPTIRVRSGKGRKARVVPVHPELAAAFRMALSYGNARGGSSHRGAQVHGLAVGAGGGGACGASWRHRSRPESGDPHATPLLRPTPADARGADQLPLSLARPLVDTDHFDLPGACAGSDGEFGGSPLE